MNLKLLSVLSSCVKHRISMLPTVHAKTLLTMQLVELKNGETYNGHMVQCDSWMNVRLREVICTSKVRQPGHCAS